MPLGGTAALLARAGIEVMRPVERGGHRLGSANA